MRSELSADCESLGLESTEERPRVGSEDHTHTAVRSGEVRVLSAVNPDWVFLGTVCQSNCDDTIRVNRTYVLHRHSERRKVGGHPGSDREAVAKL